MRLTVTLTSLTLLSAAIYALAFPPAALAPLMWIALAPVFAACARIGAPRGALLLGSFAVLASVGVAFWLPGMLRDFFGVPAGWAVSATGAVFVLFAGSYWAVFGAWLGWVAKRGWASPLVIGLGFASCEFARANGFVPNPWALSVYSQLDSPLVQIADIAGPFGVAALIGGVNAALASLFVPTLRRASRLRTVVTTALVVGLVWAYGEVRLSEAFGDPGRAVALEVVHLPVGMEPGDVPFRDRSEGGVPDLVLWPESSVDYSLRDASPRANGLLRIAATAGTPWLMGAPDTRRSVGRTHYFNSLYLIDEGRLAAQLDKVELMPFAERNPLRGWLALERSELTPGARVRTLPLAATRFGAAICSEAMDPSYVRRLVDAGAEWIANPAKDRWFGSPPAAEMQLAATRLRAIESRRFVARAASGGVSAVVDAHGRVLARADGGGPTRLAATLLPSGAETLYQRAGDGFAWLAAGTTLLVPWLPPRRSRRQLEV